MYVKVLIELKGPGVKIDRDALGQGIDYLYRVAHAQPSRQKITIMISNIADNEFICMEKRDSGDYAVTHYGPAPFEQAVGFLDWNLRDPEQQPEDPQFFKSLGPLERPLGNTSTSTVAEFTIRRLPDDLIPVGITDLPAHVAVKHSRGRAFDTEITILKQILQAGGHRGFPTLIFHSLDKMEFGITPVGIPADPAAIITSQSISRSVLTHILDAITWLHSQGIIHRDIRWDNIVLYADHPLLIDFGVSICIPTPSPVKYYGGYICCPPRLLDNIRQHYHPTRADDYHAYVLLANALLFPCSTVGFVSHNIEDRNSSEAVRLRELWEDLRTSSVWAPFVHAAVGEDVLALRNVQELFVKLNVGPQQWEIGVVLSEDEGEEDRSRVATTDDDADVEEEVTRILGAVEL
ncbi:hypothetical protein K440DRAFT_26246 [Wilcoxina mikolae CBS 423.85]|nr:hypothetical protein K440DRAFT_26246 [Wilcoxina mikolae CBS 423.85]